MLGLLHILIFQAFIFPFALSLPSHPTFKRRQRFFFLLPKLSLPESLSPQAAVGQRRVGKGPLTVASVENVNTLDVSDHHQLY